jgi:hypothetical protein
VTRRPAHALLAAAIIAALAGTRPVGAAEPTLLADSRPTWSSLTPAQQGALQPLQREWASIDPPRKEKWLELAGRFPSMPEAERQRVRERMADWARMTPAERGQARLQFQETRQFSPQDRQARWEAYKALPDDERRALAQKAKPAPKPPAPEIRASGVTEKHAPNHPQGVAVAKPVAPTLVQAKPGASTSLITARPAAPPASHPGLPKLAGTQGLVNPKTLLPQRGPQSATVQAAAIPASANQR